LEVRRVLLTLLGLILLTILSFYCFKDKAPSIREGIVANSKNALSQKGFDWASVDLKGEGLRLTNSVVLTGTAPSLEAKSEAERAVYGVAGVGSVDNRLVVAQNEEPIIQEAKSEPKPEVAEKSQDNTVKEEELPPIVAKDVEPQKENKSVDKEKREVYSLIAKKSKDGDIVLEGFVASKEDYERLIEIVQKSFDKDKITDNLKVDENAPKDWQYISYFLVEKLMGVDYGDINLTNNSYLFNAHLPSHEKKMEFLNGIKEVMANPDNKYGRYRGDYVITAPIPMAKETPVVAKKEEPIQQKIEKPAPTKKDQLVAKSCQEYIDETMNDNKIYFDYDKATIKSDSYHLLDEIANILSSCTFREGEYLEIAGHTDSIGSPNYNQKLSEERALSVATYLINRGVSSSKIKAVGYGESMPIASNINKAGRAKNRRIEFNIKERK
jgi:outer membrane protein OmpA-like peptidoglycan-associated protein/osmotically-inducible protein OsmY